MYDVFAYGDNGSEELFETFKESKKAFDLAGKWKNEHPDHDVYVQETNGEEIINDWCIAAEDQPEPTIGELKRKFPHVPEEMLMNM